MLSPWGTDAPSHGPGRLNDLPHLANPASLPQFARDGMALLVKPKSCRLLKSTSYRLLKSNFCRWVDQGRDGPFITQQGAGRRARGRRTQGEHEEGQEGKGGADENARTGQGTRGKRTKAARGREGGRRMGREGGESRGRAPEPPLSLPVLPRVLLFTSYRSPGGAIRPMRIHLPRRRRPPSRLWRRGRLLRGAAIVNVRTQEAIEVQTITVVNRAFDAAAVCCEAPHIRRTTHFPCPLRDTLHVSRAPSVIGAAPLRRR